MSTLIEQPVATGGVRWITTDQERAKIADMLKIDASIFAHVEGNVMNGPREQCSGCGKHSGLDDMVHNAVQLGVHGKEFMVDVLVNGPKGGSPAHSLQCSGCGEMFKNAYWWENPLGVWD